MARLRVMRLVDGAVLEVDRAALRWSILDPNTKTARGARAITCTTTPEPGSVPVLPDGYGTLDEVMVLGDVDPAAEDLGDQALPRARHLRPATEGEEREVRSLSAILRRALRRFGPSLFPNDDDTAIDRERR